MKKWILIIVIVFVVFAGILVAFFISRLNSSDLNNQESQILALDPANVSVDE